MWIPGRVHILLSNTLNFTQFYTQILVHTWISATNEYTDSLLEQDI